MALPQTETVGSAVNLVLGKAIRRFSELVLEFDYEIEQYGSAAGIRWLLPHFVAGYEAIGKEIIPKDGPLLIVGNHPASYDGLVISAYVNRSDHKIMIGEFPPYNYLPHISH